MTLSIVDKLNEWMEPIKGWIDANHGNPVFWVGLVIAGVAIFFMTYGALSKNG